MAITELPKQSSKNAFIDSSIYRWDKAQMLARGSCVRPSTLFALKIHNLSGDLNRVIEGASKHHITCVHFSSADHKRQTKQAPSHSTFRC